MNSIIKESIIVVASLAITSPSFAGTQVVNSTTNRNSWGSGKSQFTSIKNSAGSQDNFSQSIKAESYAPNATASATLKNGQLSGTATGSTNPVNPDPVAIITNATQTERLTFTQQDTASGFEKYNFVENGYIHQVSADSF